MKPTRKDKVVKESTLWRLTKDLKNPDLIFDLVVWAAYCSGHNDGQVPVDDSRQVFERIKYLITFKAPKRIIKP